MDKVIGSVITLYLIAGTIISVLIWRASNCFGLIWIQ